MVTIATFNEPAKAKELKTRFQHAGVHADAHNEAPLQTVGFMSRPQANAKVLVDDTDFERAQSLMVEWEATDPVIAAALIRCPQCGYLHTYTSEAFEDALARANRNEFDPWGKMLRLRRRP